MKFRQTTPGTTGHHASPGLAKMKALLHRYDPPAMPPSFFSAALATWRASHAPVPAPQLDADAPDAIVKLSIKALPDARTADTLGSEREGTGVVIDENGLIL
ncbi:MAG TPA: hypothetical protein VFK15_05655, partial [Burkholderiales bacterium]|nr:hypothetical protein [Burkholderiales bacterium]